MKGKLRDWRKAVLAGGLSLALLALTACGGTGGGSTDGGAEAEAEEAPAETILTGSAAGRNGAVDVSVTVRDGAITDVTVTGHGETEGIGTLAVDALPGRIVETQSIRLDAVSGATITSGAILEAVRNALISGGLDPAAYETAAAVETEPAAYDTLEADVVIVGAGGAGMTAAVTALEQGASVIVLEKSGSVGGNSLCGQVGWNAAGSAVQEELGMEYAAPELLKAAQMLYGGRENLVDAYVEYSGKAVDWFHDTFGVTFTSGVEHESDPADPLASLGESHPSGTDLFMVRADEKGFTSATLLSVLEDAFAQSGAALYLNTEAVGLETDEAGRVNGVRAVCADGAERVFTGKAVLLATGGFGQNHELVTEVRPDLENAITDERAPTTGDGIRMAAELGAKTVDMEAIQTFPHVMYGDTWLSPMAMPGGFMTTAIFVNQDAQRYTTEGFDPTVPDSLKQKAVYTVFNAEDLNDTLAAYEARGMIASGETPEELAAALGLDGAALTATVEQWNADCAAGADSQFDNQTLKPLEGPLYGYRFGVGAHYMMGGLLIDENTRVLNEDEEPIPGLYAAGEVTGGFHGKVRIDGSGVGDAFTFGRLAGERTAADTLAAE